MPFIERVAARHHQRAGPRRDRRRQGGARRDHPSPVAPARDAAAAPQLRRAVGVAARERAVRLREGRVHRRAGGQAGPARDGARRHRVPRRGRRDAAADPGQAPARHRGAQGDARRRAPAARHRRALHRRHQPRSRDGGGARPLPQRPVLPLERRHPDAAAAARARRRDRAAGQRLPRERLRDGESWPRSRASRGRRWRCCAATGGPATSASCATSSSARCSCAPPASSCPSTCPSRR